MKPRSNVVAMVIVVGMAAGCSTLHPERPFTTPRGNTPIVVVNRTGAPICTFAVETSRDNELAWDALAIDGRPFAHRHLPAGWWLRIDVKPGVYAVTAKTCDGTFAEAGREVVVGGPTTVELGGTGPNAIALRRVRELPIPQEAAPAHANAPTRL
jgi:hypothetical protein